MVRADGDKFEDVAPRVWAFPTAADFFDSNGPLQNSSCAKKSEELAVLSCPQRMINGGNSVDRGGIKKWDRAIFGRD